MNEKSKFHQQLHHKHELEHTIFIQLKTTFFEKSVDYQFQ
jgi:hypothetical protein